MDTCEKEALRNLTPYLQENLDLEFSIDYFYQYKIIISDDQRQEIMSETTKSKQVVTFLRLLSSNKMPGLFNTLCRALNESSNGFIAQELQKELQKIKSNPHYLQPGDWLHRFTPEGRNRVISQKELTLVSAYIGKEWKELGHLMGFHTAKLEQIEMQYPYSVPNQISSLLFAWKAQQGKKATVETFVKLIREVGSIDEHPIKDILIEQSQEIQLPAKTVSLQ